MYKKDNQILTTVKPYEYEYKKLKANSNYNQSKIRTIPLNAKLFGLIGEVKDKSDVISLHLNEKDKVSDDILITIYIV